MPKEYLILWLEFNGRLNDCLPEERLRFGFDHTVTVGSDEFGSKLQYERERTGITK